ncbi:MAG: hypothetical protein RJA25_2111 [Bacteroidota bacterium]|jgi:hypothetical protein
MEHTYQSLKEFYPYYLTEHSNQTCRTLHYIGTSLLFIIVGVAVYTGTARFLFLLPLVGYGFAWLGHFAFEKNKPATFKYPFYSLASDFIMFFHFITGQIDEKLAEAKKIIK